jgi:uncharacterized membrane protein
MKFLRLIIFILVAFISASLLPTRSFAQDFQDSQQAPQATIAEAEVLSITNTSQSNPTNHLPIKKVSLRILSGTLKNKTLFTTDNDISTPYSFKYQTGSHVIVTLSQGPGGQTVAYITDIDRKPVLLLLAGLFVFFILFIARRQGVTSILGMIVSLLAITHFVIPRIVAGADPLSVTLIASFFIIPITYYLAHGINRKTTVAIIGTLVTLLFTGFLIFEFVQLTQLTGYASEESAYLQNMGGVAINIKNLLIAGIIIGALAVLNDITISQASLVESLHNANPSLSSTQLYLHAMNVGHDHVASLVNTLVLVYVGASLPLVILFYHSPVSLDLILNQEIIATEIVRTLVTSIGIVAAVPVTTYIASISVSKKK